MSETATGVKWEEYDIRDQGIIYRSDGFNVRVDGNNWWAHVDNKLVADNYAYDFATTKRDAERWILEREGRLPAPAPATDGGGWIACSERMPDVGERVEVIHTDKWTGTNWWDTDRPTHWRPLPVDPHAVAACLFGDDRPTLEQARAAARHVAGCDECRAKLEEKGGA